PLVFALVVVTALALLAAGCGGGSPPTGVANLDTTATTTTASSSTPQSQQAKAIAYSRCMQTNGVRAFQILAFNDKVVHIASIDPHFAAAQRACAHLLPSGVTSPQNTQQQRAELADELSFAQCMRRRGVARFPDPTAQGELSVAMVAAQGINVDSPQI